jgi:hypothetical protein
MQDGNHFIIIIIIIIILILKVENFLITFQLPKVNAGCYFILLLLLLLLLLL